MIRMLSGLLLSRQDLLICTVTRSKLYNTYLPAILSEAGEKQESAFVCDWHYCWNIRMHLLDFITHMKKCFSCFSNYGVSMHLECSGENANWSRDGYNPYPGEYFLLPVTKICMCWMYCSKNILIDLCGIDGCGCQNSLAMPVVPKLFVTEIFSL